MHPGLLNEIGVYLRRAFIQEYTVLMINIDEMLLDSNLGNESESNNKIVAKVKKIINIAFDDHSFYSS